MESLAQEFATTIFAYGTQRGVDFSNITKPEMDEVVRNWYKAQVKLHNEIQEMPISCVMNNTLTTK